MNLDYNVDEMIEYPDKGVLSKVVFKNQNIECTLFCMASGTEISEHTSTKKGTVFVIDGQGIFNLEGKDIEMVK